MKHTRKYVNEIINTIEASLQSIKGSTIGFKLKGHLKQETLPLKCIFTINAKHFYVFLYVS